jgi:hypothetical protein
MIVNYLLKKIFLTIAYIRLLGATKTLGVKMWKELLTTYWSQTTLLLLGVGYLLKRVFDDRSKRVEINHTLFQQNRISAVGTFFKSYAAVELMWRQVQVHAIANKKLDAKEIDEYVFPPINSLKTSLIELQIYFSKDSYKKVEEIYNNILSINDALSQMFFWSNDDDRRIEVTNKFAFHRDAILKKNSKLLDTFTDEIRAEFSRR